MAPTRSAHEDFMCPMCGRFQKASYCDEVLVGRHLALRCATCHGYVVKFQGRYIEVVS